jgi:hypothetical protein
MGLITALSSFATNKQRHKGMGSLVATDHEGPQPPKITLKELLCQFWVDIYGKEVQSASTYSYTWVADQVGHVCIGIVLSFGLAILVTYLLPPHNDGASLRDSFVGLALATLIVSYWEYRAYQSSVAGATHVFPLRRKLLRQNAVIAAGYMAMGAVVGFAFQQVRPWGIVGFAAMLLLAIICAPPWLRQKIIWQKAALPYLFRLADVQRTVEIGEAHRLQNLISKGPKPYQVVVGGPIDSGRTSFAAGIGTEFAFRKAKVRYLTFNSLLEFAAHKPQFGDDAGPSNINYWPWSEAQVVIIDDLGPLIAAQDQQANLDNFRQLLESKLANVAPVLARCFTVWVIGDLRPKGQTTITGETLNQFGRAIARFCKPSAGSHIPVGKEFLVVELSEKIGPVQEPTSTGHSVSRKADVRELTL